MKQLKEYTSPLTIMHKIYQTKNYQIKHMVFESDLRFHKQ